MLVLILLVVLILILLLILVLLIILVSMLMLKLTYLYIDTKTQINTNTHTNIIINVNTDTHTNTNTCFPPLLRPGIALSNPLISKSSRLTKGILQAFKSSVHTASCFTNISLYNREQKSRRAEIYQVMILFCGMSGLA